MGPYRERKIKGRCFFSAEGPSHMQTAEGKNQMDKRPGVIRSLFNRMATTYDRGNRTLSLMIDQVWRRKTVSSLGIRDGDRVLDIATGTADMAIEAARQALYASKVTSYAQGLGLLKIASDEFNYDLKMGEIAKIWRAGCIIRADLLGDIMSAYQRNPLLNNLILDESFRAAVENRQTAWRFVVQTAVGMGIPVLALGASLSYFDAYRSERLPANLTQAQRDYFGAHTYERIDAKGTFHTEWQKE